MAMTIIIKSKDMSEYFNSDCLFVSWLYLIKNANLFVNKKVNLRIEYDENVITFLLFW